ncbi:MAG: MBL fold metallo-hydrolase, partial [Chitinivibrionales bacterium]
MKIHFHGAVRTVTGSKTIVEVNNSKILLDCGMVQGKRQESYELNKNLTFDASEIDAMILSHSHIDHSGNIPSLVRSGFKGSIYATKASTELCKIMLQDTAHIQERDIEWVNKIRAKQHLHPFKPIYTIEDVEKTIDMFVGIDYDKKFTVVPGVNVFFRDAGHILGSAGIHLEITENGKLFNLGFSGDIGRPDIPIMNDPNKLRGLDGLIMETTYGDRLHDDFENTSEELASYIRESAKNGGRILIPAFAVGRTQLIIYMLHKLFDSDRIPEIPVYVDSPMAVHATEVFESYLDELDRETHRIFLDGDRDPFRFSRLKYVNSVEESKSLNDLRYPHVIISASGMLEGGRVLHHLRNSIENHRTTILFVGFAAKHTLARKIQEGGEVVKIFG